MKTLILTAVVACFLTTGFAQQALNSFNRVSVTGSVKLTLKKGDTNQYTATGDTEKLKVHVEDGKLKVTRVDIKDGWKHPAYVTVWYTDIQSLDASAGAQVAHEGTLNAGDFELNFDTGANGDISIDAQSLDVNVGEGGILRLEGAAKAMEADAMTGGILKAKDLVAHRVYANSHTGAVMTVQATEEIEANATLGGSVSYSGDPEIVRVKESLGGSVRG